MMEMLVQLAFAGEPAELALDRYSEVVELLGGTPATPSRSRAWDEAWAALSPRARADLAALVQAHALPACTAAPDALTIEDLRRFPMKIQPFSAGSAELGDTKALDRFLIDLAPELDSGEVQLLFVGGGSPEGDPEFNRALSVRRSRSAVAHALDVGVPTQAVAMALLGVNRCFWQGPSVLGPEDGRAVLVLAIPRTARELLAGTRPPLGERGYSPLPTPTTPLAVAGLHVRPPTTAEMWERWAEEECRGLLEGGLMPVGPEVRTGQLASVELPAAAHNYGWTYAIQAPPVREVTLVVRDDDEGAIAAGLVERISPDPARYGGGRSSGNYVVTFALHSEILLTDQVRVDVREMPEVALRLMNPMRDALLETRATWIASDIEAWAFGKRWPAVVTETRWATLVDVVPLPGRGNPRMRARIEAVARGVEDLRLARIAPFVPSETVAALVLAEPDYATDLSDWALDTARLAEGVGEEASVLDRLRGARAPGRVGECMVAITRGFDSSSRTPRVLAAKR
jgi:hypothetical protein